VLVNAMPLGAGPAGVVTTLADLTGYQHAQEGVRLSEERYRGLVETLPLMVVQSDRQMQVTYVNPALRQITGYELAEVAEPAAWGQHVHPDDRRLLLEMGDAALAGKEGRGEIRYRAKDGSDKVGFLIVQPRRQGGEVVGVTTLIVDMTRERRLEQELQRAQRLGLIGRLSSGVAHDFNNLLNVVLNLTELARGNLPPEHPVHQDLRRIAEAGEQAAALAGQLLALSRQRRATARPVEVNRVVRRTLDLLKATLPSQVVLEAELDEGDLLIRGDETQLQQVLVNLCLNARDAMPQGGRLRVRTAADGQPGSGQVLLSVGDEGVGIDEQAQARIFEPFYTTKEGGAGLGLAMVQQIVAGFGGRVEVASRPGQGARFDVWLPRVADEGWCTGAGV
jgi:PAS domain S-box-containing protein